MAGIFGQQLLMSRWPCEVFDSVAMLSPSLTFLFEPISWVFQPAQLCDLQNSLVSPQADCDCYTDVYYYTMMQHSPACSLNTESRVILLLQAKRHRERKFSTCSEAEFKAFQFALNSFSTALKNDMQIHQQPLLLQLLYKTHMLKLQMQTLLCSVVRLTSDLI